MKMRMKMRWIRFRLAARTSHEHYCEACDRHWPHDGEDGRSCTLYWAWRCEACRPAPTPEPPEPAPQPVGDGFALRFTIEERPRVR
ncbi:MAG TPA: hypothetical protein VGX21_08750 [Methylomirabilota bacterium]|jgi:hypothetical protein|nr:hypothetical protein [Methylomirabilota bacterium]